MEHVGQAAYVVQSTLATSCTIEEFVFAPKRNFVPQCNKKMIVAPFSPCDVSWDFRISVLTKHVFCGAPRRNMQIERVKSGVWTARKVSFVPML